MTIDQIDRIKAKQAVIREQRRLFEENISTQDDFEKYMNTLKKDEKCCYLSGIHGVVDLCNSESFQCRFRSKEFYSFFGDSPKKECRREELVKFEKILEHKRKGLKH